MIFHSHYTHWYRFVYIFIMEFLLTIDFCLFCQAYRPYPLYSLIALFRFNVYSIMDSRSIWSYHLTVSYTSDSGSLLWSILSRQLWFLWIMQLWWLELHHVCVRHHGYLSEALQLPFWEASDDSRRSLKRFAKASQEKKAAPILFQFVI